MLMRVFIDKIYLYDDHLLIKRSKVTDKDIPFIEESFDNSSNTNKNGAPNRTYSNIYIYKGGFALNVWFEEV